MFFKTIRLGLVYCLALSGVAALVAPLQAQTPDMPRPAGAPDTDNLETAWREKNALRERISLNGLWRFSPVVGPDAGNRPAEGRGWGWFKVPGVWPDNSGYGIRWERIAQIPRLPEQVAKTLDWTKTLHAWYERQLPIPANWNGRRITLDFSIIQTRAEVWIDGQNAGVVNFPGGEVDVTKFVRPGATHRLTVLASALPLEKESANYMGPDTILKNTATVRLKGLTGDVFLQSRPLGATVGPVIVLPSVKNSTLEFRTSIVGKGTSPLRLEAVLSENGKETGKIMSAPLTPDAEGNVSFSGHWSTQRLWDTNTPQNLVQARLRLLDGAGQVLDETLPVPFGFRDFEIRGRDFFLNGKRIHLRALLSHNMNAGADLASYDASVRTCRRMQEYGFNFLFTSNYNYRAGFVSYMDGLLNATRDTGMLMAFSLPHATDFNWKLDDPAVAKRYRDLTRWLMQKAANDPAVILYAMNHNATGYSGDQNPLTLDSSFDPETGLSPSFALQRRRALIAQSIAKDLDPTRPVYHHQSGKLGDVYTINNYLNWAPIQERSDYFIPWSQSPTARPLFPVEWGMPHIASWSSYRGPDFIHSTSAYQHIWDSEFAAPLRGQDSYRMTPLKRERLMKEKAVLANGKTTFASIGALLQSGLEENYYGVQALYIDQNWRAFRTIGLSAILPWDQESLWMGAKDRKFRDNPNAFKNLQQPGIVPDRFIPNNQYIDDPSDSGITVTPVGKAFLRWNKPVLAWFGGNPEHVTECSHNAGPGQLFTRSVVVVNDSRDTVTAPWQLTGAGVTLKGTVTVKAGDILVQPVSFTTPQNAGSFPMTLSVKTGRETQTDTFTLDVVAPPAPLRAKVRLYDPLGQTARLLQDSGISFDLVSDNAAPTDTRPLLIGREALKPDSDLQLLKQLPSGTPVLLFEQTQKTLNERFNLRTQEYGLRNLYVRASHPALSGLNDENLRDWAGASTLLPDYMEGARTSHPTTLWNGFEDTRVWRMGNRGNVASVLIEKPTVGDFLPLLDGGFDLQYAPLLQYTDERGVMIFCQLDVTGRTQSDPAAQRLVAQLVDYLTNWKPVEPRPLVYAGDQTFAAHFARRGIEVAKFERGYFPVNGTLVLGPNHGLTANDLQALPQNTPILALGLGKADVMNLGVPETVLVSGEFFPQWRKSFDSPLLRGASNAENFWRVAPAVTAFQGTGEEKPFLDTRQVGGHEVLFLQAGPWLIDSAKQPMLRTTERRQDYLLSRLLANAGVAEKTPFRVSLSTPASTYRVELKQGWLGKADRDNAGTAAEWFKPEFNTDASWRPVAVPGWFDTQFADLKDYDGRFWYRKTFSVPDTLPREELDLFLGAIDDESWVWLNGRFVGEVTQQTNPDDYWKAPRKYRIQADWLKPDGNVLTVLVNDLRESGGFANPPALTTPDGPWLHGPYLQIPQQIDDPYRYYRW